jgi:ABC-type multidrug transport system fused ATPase/permease subunit
MKGYGKEMIVENLLRMVGVKNGRVMIGGKEIKYVKLKEMRLRMEIVDNKNVIFEGNIRLKIDKKNR